MFSRDSKASTAPTPPASPVFSASPTDTPQAAQKPSARPVALSIISRDLKIRGNLTCSGDIQIDGDIEGDVASHSVVIGEGADMRGTITAETVRIRGAVQGEIRAATVALEKTAEVAGNIRHRSLAIEAGARFEGQCRHMDSRSSFEKNSGIPTPSKAHRSS